MLKLLKYLLVTLVILFILTIGLSYLIARIYEKEIVDSVVSEINSQVETEIKVNSVNFSILKNFPLATVQFKDVYLASSKAFLKHNSKDDTLLYAKDIYLEFSLLDVLNKNYELKHLSLKDANVYMKVDKHGRDNFHITKATTDTTKHKLSFDLSKVILKKVRYVFSNKQTKNKFSLYAKQFALKGNFNEDEFDLSTSGTLLLDEITLNDTKYLMYPNTALNTDLLVNQSKVEIKKGSLKIGNEYLDLKGSYWFDNQSYIDIEAKSDQMTIKNILDHLPEQQHEMLENYDASGRVAFELMVKGEVGKNKTPKVELNAFVNDAEIIHSKSNIPLKELSFNAHYLSVGNLIEIRGFKGKFEESSAKGQLIIKNFKKPYFSADLKLESNLSEIKAFFELDSIETMEGNIVADIAINGQINDPKNINKSDIRSFRTKGQIKLNDAELELLQDNPKAFEHINAELTLDNNNVVIDSLSFRIDESDVKIKGKAYNALAYLLLEEEIRLNADVHSNLLDIGALVPDEEADEDELKEPFQYPTRLVARINIAVDQFVYNKFKADNLSTQFYINQEKVVISDFQLQTCSGSAFGGLNLYPKAEGGYSMDMNSKLEQIEMDELMYQLDNFGQESIIHENIDGKLNAITQVNAQLDPYFKIIKSSLDVKSNFLISNGELKNYEPMYKLSKFVELSELEEIKFDELQNVLEIKDNKLYLPQMLISSNAIDLKVSGEHSFENKFQYKLNILLSELLGKKAKKNKTENEEFGFVEDDGRGRTSLFLLVDGLGDKIKFKYDTKSVKAHIKEGFKEEKKNMKSLLKEEFGLFKNDTSVKETPKETKSTKEQFQIEWDDE